MADTIKFGIHFTDIEAYKFFKNYKKTHEDVKNVLREITLGVIDKKELPELEDVYTIASIKKDYRESEEEFFRKYEDWKAVGNNSDRGILGAFADIVNDLVIVVSINKEFKDVCLDIENIVNKQIENKNMLNEIGEELNKLFSEIKNIKINTDENDTETEGKDKATETEEDTETDTVENINNAVDGQ
jgi:hypothetical protein